MTGNKVDTVKWQARQDKKNNYKTNEHKSQGWNHLATARETRRNAAVRPHEEDPSCTKGTN